MTGQHLETALVASIAIGAVSYTISSTEATMGFRGWVVKRSLWLGKLLACPYCLSHWLAFAAVAIYRPWLSDARSWFAPLAVFDYLTTAFAMLPVAMLAVWAIKLALGKATGPTASLPARHAAPGKPVSATRNPTNTKVAP
jgi:hypothetical protein